MHDNRTEQEMAWRLWHCLVELEQFLWEHYESEFIDRHLAEEDWRLSMPSDAPDDDAIPLCL